MCSSMSVCQQGAATGAGRGVERVGSGAGGLVLGMKRCKTVNMRMSADIHTRIIYMYKNRHHPHIGNLLFD